MNYLSLNKVDGFKLWVKSVYGVDGKGRSQLKVTPYCFHRIIDGKKIIVREAFMYFSSPDSISSFLK